MTMQEHMKQGRKGMKEIDGTLNRAEKLVEDTLQIGQQVGPTQWLGQQEPLIEPSDVLPACVLLG